MMIDVKIPSLGESITKCVLHKWFVEEGQRIEKGAVLFEVELDGESSEATASESGVVTRMVAEGATLPIGAVVGQIDTGESARLAEADPPQSIHGSGSGEESLASSAQEGNVRAKWAPRKRPEVTSDLRFIPDEDDELDSPIVVARETDRVTGLTPSEGAAKGLYLSASTNDSTADAIVLLKHPAPCSFVHPLETFEVHCRVGEVIKEGEPLITLNKAPRYMRPELQTLTSPSSGMVLRVFAQPGRGVQNADPLILLSPPTLPDRVRNLPWEGIASRQRLGERPVDLRLPLDLLSFKALKHRLPCPLELADRLVELQAFSGWSQQKMAESLEVNQSTLSRYLSISNHLYPGTKEAFREARKTAHSTLAFRHLHALCRFHHRLSPAHLDERSCRMTQLDHFRSLAHGSLSLASLEKRVRHSIRGGESKTSVSAYAPRAFFERAFSLCPGRALDLFGADGEIESAVPPPRLRKNVRVTCFRFADDALQRCKELVPNNDRVLISALTRENLLRTARERRYHHDDEPSGILRRELTMAHVRATLETSVEKLDIKDAVFLTQDWWNFHFTLRLDALFSELGFHVIVRERIMEDFTISHYSKKPKLPASNENAWS